MISENNNSSANSVSIVSNFVIEVLTILLWYGDKVIVVRMF